MRLKSEAGGGAAHLMGWAIASGVSKRYNIGILLADHHRFPLTTSDLLFSNVCHLE
jgi:hypothetical protein